MKIQNINLFNLGIGLFLVFVVFTILVSVGIFTQIDSALTTTFQSIIPRAFDTPFSVFSILGSAEVTLIFFFIIALLIFSGIKNIYIFGAFITLGLIELLLKSYIPQIPPPSELLRTNLHIGFPSGEVAGDHFAYPSGHSGRTAFIAIILTFGVLARSRFKISTKKVLIGAIFFFTAIMFISRIYLAEHWATDVVGGALLGFSLAIIGIYFYKRQIGINKKN